MAKKSHNGAFVIGSVLGGAIGAATALWKTPMSGHELREKLGVGDLSVPSQAQSVDTSTNAEVRKENKILSFVEQAAAPIVGVTLGQTANNGGVEPVAVASEHIPSSPSTQMASKDTNGFTPFPDLKA